MFSTDQIYYFMILLIIFTISLLVFFAYSFRVVYQEITKFISKLTTKQDVPSHLVPIKNIGAGESGMNYIVDYWKVCEHISKLIDDGKINFSANQFALISTQFKYFLLAKYVINNNVRLTIAHIIFYTLLTIIAPVFIIFYIMLFTLFYFTVFKSSIEVELLIKKFINRSFENEDHKKDKITSGITSSVIEKLYLLKEKGMITEDEFIRAKNKLLAN